MSFYCWRCVLCLKCYDDVKKRQKKAHLYQQHALIGSQKGHLKGSAQKGPYLSTDPAKPWKGYHSTTSGASSAEPSPAIRLTPAFTEFGEDGVKESRGFVDFSLQYDQGDEKLHVHLIGARQLPLSIYGNAHDSFLKVLVIRDVRKRWLSPRPSALSLPELEQEASKGSAKFVEFRTRTIRRTSSPVFDESFETPVRDKDLRNTVVKVMAFLTDRHAHNCLCGEATVQLRREDLENKKIYEKALLKIDENVGDVTVCLTYLPTAGRVCLNLIKATNLRVPGMADDNLNPQVRASLMLRTKTLEKHKIPPQLSTRSPVYNQTLTFDVRSEEVDKVVLLLTLTHREIDENQPSPDSSNEADSASMSSGVEPPRRRLSRQGSSHSGLIKMRSGSASNIQDLLKEEEEGAGKLVKAKSSLGLRSRTVVIGRVAFGASVRGSARKHWEEMVQNPRKQFTRCHKLLS